MNLIALAGLATSEVRFVNRRFENAVLDAPFAAVFSASAFHWPDPDVSWRKAARSLRRLTVVPAFIERTPQELNALFRTTSVYHRLAPPQRDALERANIAIGDRLGRPIRSNMLAVLVTARSVGSAP